LGATHVLNARRGDPVQAILAVINRGVDFALDTSLSTRAPVQLKETSTG
jgi:hypothetical protein